LRQDPGALGRGALREIRDLRLAENLDRTWVDVLEKSRKCQSGFLNVGAIDDVVETLTVADEHQLGRFGGILQQLANGDAGNGAALVLAQQLAPSEGTE
jgi:hypothetical protein